MKEMALLQKKKGTQFKKLIMTVAGGDGTLMFLAKDAIELGCKIDKLTFCILPYGTGNDLAQTLGWGAQPKDIWTQKLKLLASEIINA